MSTMDTNFESVIRQLGLGEDWEEVLGAWWIKPEGKDVRAITSLMLSHGARFVTITAAENASGEFNLGYHWDLKGQLLAFQIPTSGKRIASIYDLVPEADHAEHQIHDYFSIGFSGRSTESHPAEPNSKVLSITDHPASPHRRRGH